LKKSIIILEFLNIVTIKTHKMEKTITLLLIAFFISISVDAQWSTDTSLNTPICVLTGNQREQRMLKDGKGGAYIVWKDYRTGIPDIYIQRVNQWGIPKWTINGIGMCTNVADQSTPNIVTDMKGGAIVVWSDWRSNIERDVYAQRVDSNGNMKWIVDGAPVATKTNREHTPKMISDDAGGMIVCWEQQTAGMWDVWAQRLDSNGTQKWASGGIPLVTGVGTMNRRNHKIEQDGKGGAIIVWQDERNGSGNFDIYAQRLDRNGNLKWGTTGKAICTAANVQNDPKIDPDSLTCGAFIVWADKRNGVTDIYAQRVDSNGNSLWTNNGIAVCTASGIQSAADVMSTSKTAGPFITWKDERNGNYDIYIQKLNNQGVVQWTNNGINVCNNIATQLNPDLCNDNSNGVIVTWQDSSGNGFDIKAQRFTATGTELWRHNGVTISSATGDQYDPKLTGDGKGGAIFTWTDKRSGVEDVYIHHLYGNGTTSGISAFETNTVLVALPNPFSNYFSITIFSTEEFITTFSDLAGRDLTESFHKTVTQKNGKQEINFNLNEDNLLPGFYLFNIRNEEINQTVKLIKQ
jgi:hypothetical protein